MVRKNKKMQSLIGKKESFEDGIAVLLELREDLFGQITSIVNTYTREAFYPALYSYCKYTNIPSIKTAEAIGMHFDKEYPDEANEITHVSVIYREDI